MKKYKLGFIVGRFQGFHLGHKMLIEQGLEDCDKFIILIGSSDKSRTLENPFSFEERRDLIRISFKNKNLDIYALPDRTEDYSKIKNDTSWGEYVLSHIKKYTGNIPDYTIQGNEGKRKTWYDDKYNIYINKLERNELSGSNFRNDLLNNNIESLKSYTDLNLHPALPLLCERYIEIKEKTSINGK